MERKDLFDNKHQRKKHHRSMNVDPHLKAKEKKNSGRRTKQQLSSTSSYNRKGGTQRRYVDASHLTGFVFDASQGRSSSPPPGRRGGRTFQRRSSQRQMTREEFLQANCHFRVAAGSDYSVQLADADVPFEWENIEEVILFTTAHQSCPICLGPPVAAHITRCGHVFCWSCILHHLALSEKSWNTCPLCSDFVYSRDLRSVVLKLVNPIKAGQKLVMTKMLTVPDTAVAVPAACLPSREVLYNPSKLALEMAGSNFARVHPINDRHVLKEIVARELSELTLPDVDQDDPYVKMAFRQLAARAMAIDASVSLEDIACMQTGDSTSLPSHITDRAEALDLQLRSSPPPAPVELTWSVAAPTAPGEKTADALDDNQGRPSDPLLPFPDASMDMRPSQPKRLNQQPSSAAPRSPDFPTFYQTPDGRPAFLHPLCTKMLEMEHDSLASAPLSLEARVVQVEIMTVDSQTRKRMSQLRHVPMYCEMLLVELDMSRLVSAKVMEEFQPALEKRKAARRRKARAEQRAYENAQKQSADMYESFASTMNQHTLGPSYTEYSPTDADFPLALSPGQQAALELSRQLDRDERQPDRTESSANESNAQAVSTTPPVRAFANAASMGIMSDATLNPTPQEAMRMKTSPSARDQKSSGRVATQSGWATAVASTSPRQNKPWSGVPSYRAASDRDEQDEDAEFTPSSYRESFAASLAWDEEVLARALASKSDDGATSSENQAPSGQDGSTSPRKGKKKKRAQKQLLFSTASSAMYK